MSVSILCIGDPHFQDNNKTEYDEMVEKTLNVASKEKPDYIVIMGDTLDRFKMIHQDPHYDACQFFYKLKEIAPLYVLIGNHDRRSPAEFMTEKNPFHTIRDEIITIVWRTHSLYNEILEKNLVFVPYVPKGMFNKAIEDIDMARTASFFAHQEFKGCEYQGIVSDDGDVWSIDKPPIISGHIHKYGKMGNITYVGTPMQHKIDEVEEKSISLFTFYPNETLPREKRIFLKCRRKEKIVLTAKQFKKWSYDPDTTWHITLYDTEGNLAAVQGDKKYRDLAKKGVKFSECRKYEGDASRERIDFAIESSNYIELLQKRIQNDEGQKKWLKRFLEEGY